MQVRLDSDVEKAVRIKSAQSDPHVTIPRLVNMYIAKGMEAEAKSKRPRNRKSAPVPARHS